MTVSSGATMKLAALPAVPRGAMTVSVPLVAPAGTMAVICVLLFTVKEAAAPLKVSAVAPLKPVPVMVTTVPTGPEAGVKLVIRTGRGRGGGGGEDPGVNTRFIEVSDCVTEKSPPCRELVKAAWLTVRAPAG